MEDLIQKLSLFKESLLAAEKNEKLFVARLEEFRNFLAKYSENHIIEQFLSSNSETVHDFKSFFGKIEKQYVKKAEFQTALTVLNDNNLLDLKNTPNNSISSTGEHVSYEYGLISSEKPNTLVMIGSGPFPSSMLYYAINTDVPNIIGIDNDAEAINIARKVTDKFQFTNRISFVNINAQKYNYDKADVIIVGSFVTPKFDILKRVAETSKKNVKILLRIPTGLDRLVYEYIDSEQINKLNLNLNKTLDKVFDIGDTTLLLTKK